MILCYEALTSNGQLGVPAYASFPKLYHPSTTILSATVSESLCIAFLTRDLCVLTGPDPEHSNAGGGGIRAGPRTIEYGV